MAGRVTTLWVKRPLSVNQHGQLSLPSLRGWLETLLLLAALAGGRATARSLCVQAVGSGLIGLVAQFSHESALEVCIHVMRYTNRRLYFFYFSRQWFNIYISGSADTHTA